jgi:hypothetical protein
VNGWTGSGYIILDPGTGAGAYKISGGANGAWLVLAVFIILALVIIGGFLAGGPALIVAAFAFVNFKAFADNIKKIAESGASPEMMANLANKAAFLSMSSLMMSLLGFLVGPAAEYFIPAAWATSLLGAGYIFIFNLAWFG